jgi:DNA polymerase-3 subunit alpha
MKDFSDEVIINDPEVYKLISRGETGLVFQLNSPIGKKYSKLVKPQNIEELSMLVALTRPNVLNAGLDKDFISVRNGERQPIYPDPRLEKILGQTYGISLYQEQIITLGKEVAGFSEVEADWLRHAMGKKDRDVMKKLRRKFLEGGIKNKYSLISLMTIWRKYIKAASSYVFNKSHATVYAYNSARTAYFCAHYPLEFICSNLIHSDGDLEEIKKIINVAASFGISIKLPNIKKSGIDFTIDKTANSILFGLKHIKGIGKSVLPKIKNIVNYVGIDKLLVYEAFHSTINKTVMNALIFSGAFDCLDSNRCRNSNAYNLLLEFSEREGNIMLDMWHDSSSVRSLVNGFVEHCKMTHDVNKNRMVKIIELQNRLNAFYELKENFNEIILKERGCLGISLTGCETDTYDIDCNLCLDLKTRANRDTIRLCVLIDDVRSIKTKKGDMMAFIRGFDSSGSVDFVFFPQLWGEYKDRFVKGSILYITGTVEKSRGENVIANKIRIVKK